MGKIWEHWHFYILTRRGFVLNITAIRPHTSLGPLVHLTLWKINLHFVIFSDRLGILQLKFENQIKV